MNDTLLSYSVLSTIKTFEGRLHYLKLQGLVGEETFGHDRWINQSFYKSSEWLNIRRAVISRDNGCDLSLRDFPIRGKIIIHHINPVTVDMIKKGDTLVLDLDNLICVSDSSHRYIHYGVRSVDKVERQKGDTKLW